MFSLLLLCTLTADSEPAPVVLPMRSLVLHRNQVGWVERAGSVAVVGGKTTIAIDPTALPGTWHAETPGGKPAIERITNTTFGPLAAPNWSIWAAQHAGELLQLTTDRGEIVGRITPFPIISGHAAQIGVESAGELFLVDPGTVRHLRRTLPPMATVELPADVKVADLSTSALVAGFGWKPDYLLYRGPDGAVRLQLFARIRHPADEPIDVPKAFCAVGFPRMSPLPPGNLAPEAGTEPSAADVSLFELGAVSLPVHHERRIRLVDCKASSTIVFEWIVGGVAMQGPESASERVETLLRLTNTAGRSLPPGPVLVTHTTGVWGAAGMPYTPGGAVAELRLGPAAGLECRREEIEIERKQPKIRVENELYDYVKMAGTLTIVNKRPEAALLEIEKTFDGDGIAASDGGTVRRLPNQAGRALPLSQVQWKLSLAPGDTKRLTYGYMLYLAVGADGK